MIQDLMKSVSGVTTEDLRYYLAKTGWTESQYKKIDQIKYQFQGDDLFVLVPRNRTVDYVHLVNNLITTLSQVEDRDPALVVKNILNPNVDTLKFRFLGSSAESGSLPLDYMLNAVQNIRDSLIFSACGELNSRPSYERQMNRAKEMIEKSRFGQTEIGSFVITVDMPLVMPVAVRQAAAQPQPTVVDQNTITPIERRIISRIIRGVEKARNVAFSGDQVDPANDYRVNLNANLAEALSALRPDGADLNVELSAVWDRSIATAGLPMNPVVIEERTFESLKSIGSVLRGSIESRSVELRGRISGLTRDDSDPDDEANENWVTIRTTTENMPKTIRVSLSAQDYLRACDWHRDKTSIMIKGTLEKPGKNWLLTGYSDLTHIP